MNLDEVLLAGILVSGVVFLLGVTRIANLVAKFIPLSLVRGIQLGLGVKLAVSVSNGSWA